MLQTFIKQSITSIILLLIFIVITGILYPLLITGIAQKFFATQANGSLLVINNKIIGSSLIGQAFDSPKYFWGRPSATVPFPYNASASMGSNLGPTNPNLIHRVKQQIALLHKADPKEALDLVPVDLVTTSASGLDPDISPLAAVYQAHRVAKARNLSEEVVVKLIKAHIKHRQFGIFGEPRVNVLELNLALDDLDKKK